MLRSLDLSDSASRSVCIGIGCAEVSLGIVLILVWRLRWPAWLILAAMPVSALAVAFNSPGHLTAPFNPITLNLSVFAIAAIMLLGARDLPSAARCSRRPPRRDT